MYALVDDIPSYPDFLPWCKKAEVLSSGPGVKRAALTLQKGPLSERFVTRNTGTPPNHIHLALDEGPFRHLDGHWRFTDLGPEGCKVTLDIEFELAGFFMAKMLNAVLTRALDSLVDAFCARARVLYGPQGAGTLDGPAGDNNDPR